MKMDDESNNGKGFAASWSLSAKPCDSCKSSSALLFCRADSAFLCIGCDSKIHTANKLASRHERVWMCEVCEQAPASVTCKADAAALCVTCDRDIHSANPLARRHERFPVVPFYESAASALKSNSMNLLVPDGNGSIKDDHQDNNDEVEVEVEVDEEDEEQDQREEAEAASWLLTNPNLVNINHKPPPMETPDLNCADQYFFSDIDPYLDLDYTTSSMASGGRFPHHHHSGTAATTDSVVPVQPEPHHLHTSLLHPELDFCRSKPSYSYTTPSLSQSVSSSSVDVGVVPDGNNSDISNAFMNNNGMGSVAVSAQACQLTGMDREARVLRYREKRKNRKFEKTIRYASRKAYAETRPRIKGRFAKRTELEAEVDRLYSSAASLMADASGYGIVPSF